MNHEIDRRTFLKHAGQAGGLIAAGGTLEYFLVACGGNIQTGAPSDTTGPTTIPNKGLKIPGVLQWGSDFVGGAPYVFKDRKTLLT